VPLRTSTAARLPLATTPSSDSLAAPEDDQVPLLGVYDFDPWAEWPQVDDMPMPLQTMPAQIETAGQQVAASDDTAIAAPPDDGAVPMDFGPAAVVTVALGLLGGTWRSRRGLRLWLASIRRMDLRPPAVARALALVRLGLGLLRLW